METPSTITEEIIQVLAASPEPLTRPEILERCKLADDAKRLSVTLATLAAAGRIRRLGKRPTEGGPDLMHYTAAPAGAAPSKYRKREGARAPAGKKVARAARAASAGRRSAHGKRSRRLPKVQRKTATSAAPEGFRCGIYSDGTLSICAAEGQISLTEPETRAMFRYLERMLIAGG